jgi:Glycoside-hydrolase family GH114
MTHMIATRLPLFLTILTISAGLAHAEGSRPVLPEQLVVDYQLGGDSPPPEGVTAVVRDSTATPAPGMFNICYVNGYQTQPGATWPAELLVPGADGKPLADPNWPDEYMVDVSTEEHRAKNFVLVLPMLQACADKGFDAVEFDNLDSYGRSEGHMTLEDSIAFAKLLVEAVHGMNLAAAQKNTAELGSNGRDVIGFDFAIIEECYRWEECAVFTDVYGDQTIGIEYADDLRGTFADACADPARPRSLILRDRMLVPSDHPDYVFETC